MLKKSRCNKDFLSLKNLVKTGLWAKVGDSGKFILTIYSYLPLPIYTI